MPTPGDNYQQQHDKVMKELRELRRVCLEDNDDSLLASLIDVENRLLMLWLDRHKRLTGEDLLVKSFERG